MPTLGAPDNQDPAASEFAIWRRPINSLPTRIGFFVLGATLCSSLVVTGVSVQSIEALLHQQAAQKYPLLLENARDRLALWTRERRLEVRDLATNAQVTAAAQDLAGGKGARRGEQARAELSRLFADRLQDLPHFSALFLSNPAGRRLVWAGEPNELLRASSQLESSPNASELRPRVLANGRRVHVFSIPIARRDEVPGLTLHGVLELAGLSEVLASSSLGSLGWIGLVDPQDDGMTSAGEGDARHPFMGPITPADDLPGISYLTTPQGVEMLLVSQTLPGTDWGIALTEARSEAFRSVVQAIRRAIGINLIVVSLFALVAYRVSIRMVWPIEVLSLAARRISQGERGLALPESAAQDEVGILTRAFGEMTRRVESKATELEAIHREVEDANQKLRNKNDELHKMNDVLEQLSITDGLTQLHNHRFFQDFMSKECRSADRTRLPLALILVDVDHFKAWNDRLGHAGGDEILRRLAEVMSTLIRGSDLLARYGGEEFALVAPGTDLTGAVQLAEKMRATIAQTRLVIDPPSEREHLTVSMGVALYCGDRKQLFKDADEALYRAKGAGRDCVIAAGSDYGA